MGRWSSDPRASAPGRLPPATPRQRCRPTPSTMFSAAALGTLAVLVSVLSLVPQVVRALRTRTTDGLSSGSTALALLSCAQWSAYGLGVLDLAQVANNAVSLVLYAMLAYALTVTGGVHRWFWQSVLLGSVVSAAAVALLLSPAAAAGVAAVTGLASRVPQVQVALSADSLVGLDPWAVQLAALNPALWVVYGVVVADPLLAVANTLGCALACIVGWRRLPPRRTLRVLAEGRLGSAVARAVSPVAARFPHHGSLQPA